MFAIAAAFPAKVTPEGQTVRRAALGLAVAASTASVALIGDQITFTGVVALDEPVVVLMGRRSSGCVTEKQSVKDPSQVLDVGNLLVAHTADWSCLSEIAVFAHEHAALISKNPAFTSGVDLVTLAAPGPRIDIPLNLVAISPNQGLATNRASDAFNTAITYYNQNRVGLRFVLAGGTIRWFDPSDATVAGIGQGCESVDAVRASAVYDPSVLNVYFVPAIHMPGYEDLYGYNCFEYGAPDIIYISLDYNIATVLSHEIGHALGLRGMNGHVNNRAGFDEENLMWTGLDASTTGEQSLFTLGQAYRMNLELSSWINLKVGKGTVGIPHRQGDVKGCQDSVSANWPCLRLREAWP